MYFAYRKDTVQPVRYRYVAQLFGGFVPVCSLAYTVKLVRYWNLQAPHFAPLNNVASEVVSCVPLELRCELMMVGANG